MNFIANETAQKLRGGYYTPASLAAFIARWVATINPTTVLEPSCGDGAFIEAIASTAGCKDAEVTAFELDHAEAEKARARGAALGLSATIKPQDFLGWALTAIQERTPHVKYDAIVGNPPFIRYQYLPDEFQFHAEGVFEALRCRFTKHTNAWVPFVLASLHLLRPGGRLGMVLPAELVHVMHAQSLRDYLARECSRIVIIDPKEIWFSDTLQGAVLLLAEKASSKRATREGLGVVSVAGREFVDVDPERIFRLPEATPPAALKQKWTSAFLGKRSLEAFDAAAHHSQVHIFSQVADVDVGIVTGANKFFLVDDATVRHFRLEAWSHPMFGRSGHCPGLIYDQKQHAENARLGYPTNFIWFETSDVEKNSSARSYIELGKDQSLHTRYKCRVRSPWYSVPSVYSTEVGMLKRCHDAPRLIRNKISAFTTDTAYRISSKVMDANQLVASFINPLTSLSAELQGRYYGGGVLELVPSEIEKLLLPSPKAKLDLAALDKAVRSTNMVDVLAGPGMTLLEGIGLSANERVAIMEGWETLKNRRQRADRAENVELDAS